MKTLFKWLSPRGQDSRLSIVIFHRVLREPDPLFPDELDAIQFDKVCSWLARWFTVLPLDTAVKKLREGSLPAGALAITFDDGYADNHDVALPILRRHGLCATFFISTGFLDGGCMWNDVVIDSVRRGRAEKLLVSDLAPGLPASIELVDVSSRQRAIPLLLQHLKYLSVADRQWAVDQLFARADTGSSVPSPMMTSNQVRSMRRAGMQIGAHTVSHPILAKVSPELAVAEIVGSKQTLEALLTEPVTLFAYPNGRPGDDYTSDTVQLVMEAGFTAAVTTAWGAAQRGDSMHEIPRFTPWDRHRLKFVARMAANLRRPVIQAL